MTRRLLIVPARRGSKRIKNKNILNFYGKPIIEYGLDVAYKSKLFTTIHISTNDPKINFKYNKNEKNNFLRPNNLSTDKIPLTKVLKFVLNR
jgi:CMP-N-acetylneuraminic acid synthetase